MFHILTEVCLHHIIAAQAVLLNRWTEHRSYRWTRRVGLCVYSNDARCSHAVKEVALFFQMSKLLM